MVVIRAQINLFFDELADAIAFRDAMIPHFAKVRNLVMEKSNVVVHRCHHDEDPPGPCTEIIYQWVKPD